MLDDDAVIAESWQQPERFAVLFDRPAAYIHRYLARRTDSQAAEDLVAETFLTAFRKRRRYQHGYANARPWLYGIATHLAGQHFATWPGSTACTRRPTCTWAFPRGFRTAASP